MCLGAIGLLFIGRKQTVLIGNFTVGYFSFHAVTKVRIRKFVDWRAKALLCAMTVAFGWLMVAYPYLLATQLL
jgi:hypothetical protein